VLGEANFSDHGANRLGASRARCRGLQTDTSSSLHPRTIHRAPEFGTKVDPNAPAFAEAVEAVKARVNKLIAASTAPARWTASIASWARSCGTNAAWPATNRASKRRYRKIPKLQRGTGRISKSSDQRMASTWNSNAPRPCGRLPSEFGELMCPDRTEPEQRISWRTLPHRNTKTPEGEGAPRRRQLRLRGGLEIRRRRQGPDPHQGTAGLPERSNSQHEAIK